jgi:hypothetical protein
MTHYRISKWDWVSARLFVAAMEMGSKDPYGMNSVLQSWIGQHGLVSSKSENSVGAMYILTEVPFQELSGAMASVREAFGFGLQLSMVYLFKYMARIHPPLEDLFINAKAWIGLSAAALKPTFIFLFSNRKDLAIACFLYLVRWRYAPWILASPRSNPFVDLRGIFEDPKGYIAADSPFAMGPNPRVTVWLFIIQEFAFWIFMVFEVYKTYFPEKGDEALEALARRTSFRMDWKNADASSVFNKLKKAIASHGLAWLKTFLRIILLEKMTLLWSYWFFDLIRSSTVLVTSQLKGWYDAYSYALQWGGFIYGRYQGSSGIVPGLKLFIRIWFWTHVINRYQPTSIGGLVYRYILQPALSLLSGLFSTVKDFLTAKRDSLAKLADSMEAVAIHVVRQMDFRVLVFSTAAGMVALGILFWYMTADPLRLRSAAKSCSKAGALARRATSIENPERFLGWRATKAQTLLELVNYRGDVADWEHYVHGDKR